MICAVVLAAGRSRRMGRQKLLLPVGDRPMIARVVDEVLRSQVSSVFVVVGADREPIQEALAGRPIEFIVNTDPNGEMLSSVRCGLGALPAGCTAALVVLGDQAEIRADIIDVLIQAFRAGHGGIVVPTYAGQRGHPIVVPLRYRDELLCAYDATGLRGLLSAHPKDVLEAEITSNAVLQDIDTPEDYQRALQRTQSRQP